MTSQLEKDLTNRVDERVVQICLDSFELFRMAGLRPEEAAAAVGASLMSMAARILAIGTNEKGAKECSQIFERMINNNRKSAKKFSEEMASAGRGAAQRPVK